MVSDDPLDGVGSKRSLHLKLGVQTLRLQIKIFHKGEKQSYLLKHSTLCLEGLFISGVIELSVAQRSSILT